MNKVALIAWILAAGFVVAAVVAVVAQPDHWKRAAVLAAALAVVAALVGFVQARPSAAA